MSRIGILPVSGSSLRELARCECDAADHIPMLFVVVPHDSFRVVEWTDDRLVVERKPK